MKLPPAEFWEQRALPIVIAFGLGVILAGRARDAEVEAVRLQVRTVLEHAERVRMACGLQPDPEAVAVHVASAGEVSDERP